MLSEKQFFPTTISSLLKTIANTLKDTFTIILYASDLEYMVDCDNLFGVSDSDDVSDSEFFCQWQLRAIDSVIEEINGGDSSWWWETLQSPTWYTVYEFRA